MCITKDCEDPTSAGVWWRDDAEWKQYTATQAAAILQGVKAGAKRVELKILVSPKYAGGASYVVDLTTMKQLNLTSGYTRNVKVIPAPATAATPVTSQIVNMIITAVEMVRAMQKGKACVVSYIKTFVRKKVFHVIFLKLSKCLFDCLLDRIFS